MSVKDNIFKLIDEYKKSFTQKHWEDEKYKWQAVKHFQGIRNDELDNYIF